MDVEGTIEFILKMQAKTETRLDGITKLMQQGMRMLVRVETAQAKTEKALAELAESQKRTDRMFQAFLKGQRNGRNGR